MAKNTIAKELQDRKRHGYPPNMLYTCNPTAYFKQAECLNMIRAVRVNFKREPSILVVDDYKWHKADLFTQGFEQVNCTKVMVDGNMTGLCNPGDRFIHRILKMESRLSYESWALQQPAGQLAVPTPPRSLSAKWHHDALRSITPAMVVRSFVACRVTRVEDYSAEDQQLYCLRDLERTSLLRSLKDIIVDDHEFVAQLELESDDEAWLHEESTPHQPAEPRPHTPPSTHLLSNELNN